MSFKVKLYGGTDVGRQRGHNEDSFKVIHNVNNEWLEAVSFEQDITDTKGLIAVVADGMGGANAGEIASSIVVKTILNEAKKIDTLYADEFEYRDFLFSLVKKAHKNIVSKASQNKEMKGMGTTIVLIWIVQGYLYVVWSGDSRCYYYNKNRDKQLEPLTDDHSLVWTRVKTGEISAEEARLSDDSNLILQSLGDNNQTPTPDFIWTKLENNDRILLCSDGLNSMLSDVGIQQILDFSTSTKDTCLSLIKAANNAGGSDNITVILVDILTSESKPTVQGEVPVDKKSFRGWILIIILLLIITAGFIFHKKIINTFNKYAHQFAGQQTTDSLQNENNKDPIKNDSLAIPKTENISSQNSTEYGSNDIPKKPQQKGDENPNNEIQIDSYLIKLELTESLRNIKMLKDKIALAESQYDIAFYNKIEEKLLSINDTLDSLNIEINEIAQVNGNNVVKILKYNKAVKIYKPIGILLDNISKEIKSIAEGKNNDTQVLKDSISDILQE